MEMRKQGSGRDFVTVTTESGTRASRDRIACFIPTVKTGAKNMCEL